MLRDKLHENVARITFHLAIIERDQVADEFVSRRDAQRPVGHPMSSSPRICGDAKISVGDSLSNLLKLHPFVTVCQRSGTPRLTD